MKAGDSILGMGSTRFNQEKTKRFWKRYVKIRIRKKIQSRTIFSERTGYHQDYKKMKYTKVKVLEAITPVTVYVYGRDNVVIFNYEDSPSCIVIHDRNTADSFRNFFEQLWKIAKE